MIQHSFQAVIFDLDGVITKTALVHSAAWREMFNEYLKYREKKYGEPFREFTHGNDYLPYIDGKTRYDGVGSFLKSRRISIPYGDPGDDPERETVCGLGNKKNSFFNRVLKREGVEVYESTVTLIKQLRDENIKTGVASSSKNCKVVLERAGIPGLFDTRVDGEVSARLGLNGKPKPDIFIKACEYLGSSPDLTVIVEDAVSGVQAGRNGRFGLIIGIAREGNNVELKKSGAQIVLKDISELGGIEKIDKWFKEKE